MTDMDKLIQLLESWEIEVTKNNNEDNIMLYVFPKNVDDSETQSDKVLGYYGFFTIYTFNHDGSFVSMGAYE